MATIALPRPAPAHRPSSPLGTVALDSARSLESLNSSAAPTQRPSLVPNKHIPICPPGPVPQEEPNTPPPSPGKDDDDGPQRSLLFPPLHYTRLESGSLALYKLDAAQVAAALDYASRQPLPDAARVFPWLHGLHPNNHIQQTFFTQRRRVLRQTPCCMRGITVVKADGDLGVARLKGAIAPHEFMKAGSAPEFLDVDPREGFSVRNFQIQAAKTAMTSDIIVYGHDNATVGKVAWDVAAAQKQWKEKHGSQGQDLPLYNTFICTSNFGDFEDKHAEIVAIDAAGRLTGHVVDFFAQERKEMYAMTMASEIAHNVWLGPTPEPNTDEERRYDVLLECNDLGHLNPAALQAIAEHPDDPIQHPYLEFPSSGSILPPTWSQAEADGILETCKWVYHLAHGTRPPTPSQHVDCDGDTDMAAASEPPVAAALVPRKFLIHCADGYTESTLLAIAFYSYSTGQPVPEAWLNLHTVLKRNFFAYPTDVALLTAIAPRLLAESPACTGRTSSEITALIKDEPRWLAGLDGSFPSRVLDYMYLGNLGHANNPDLLTALGIGQILSVGESAMWRDGELDQWGEDNVCVVKGVQDNGIDPLTDEFERCLEFIDRGRRKGTATLVHCRVGVSRSATICIAEVMRSLGCSFPRAYCFVRARRLNVIIQPHLRFVYELLKWGETHQGGQGQNEGTSSMATSIRRELEWGEIAREVALMNRPYSAR